jgi:uncharacterized protein with HEPN domain
MNDFMHTKMIQDAVIRKLEIFGESVINIPVEFRAQHPEILWKKIVGMRNIFIHVYFGVDNDMYGIPLQKTFLILKNKYRT